MKKFTFTLLIFTFGTLSGIYAQPAGSLDITFGGTGKVITDFGGNIDGGCSMVIQPDGKIIASGYTNVGTNYSFALSRYNTNGSLDLSFGTAGKLITDFAPGYDYAASVILQPDGKIIAGGVKWTTNHGDNALIRYNSNGTLDPTFGTNGKVETPVGVADAGINSIRLQPDGKIVAVGISTNSQFGRDFAITRYNTNGSLDMGFGSNGIVMFDFATSYDFPFALVIQNDGKIVVGGSSGQDPVYDFAMVRLDSLGAVDATFGTNGMVTTDFGKPDEWANAMTLQPDGKILLCGYSGSPYKIAMARYNVDGTLDVTFNTTGTVLTAASTHDEATSIALQADGKIVVGGVAFNASNQDFGIVRYDSTGTQDTTFGINGFVSTDFGFNNDKIRGMGIQADGKIVAAGSAGNDFAVARYIPTLITGIIDFADFTASTLIYPNPVQEEATLGFTLLNDEKIEIRLTDIKGQLLGILVPSSPRTKGDHQVTLHFPSGLAMGSYLIVLSNGTNEQVIKILK